MNPDPIIQPVREPQTGNADPNYVKNYYQAIRFEGPAFIPAKVSISAACWNHYPKDGLLELVGTHPMLFPAGASSLRTELAPWECSSKPYSDYWGCVWKTSRDGITGSPVFHPLADWKDFDSFQPPDVEHCDGWRRLDWDAIAEDLQNRKKRPDVLLGAGLHHGHTFLRLTYLRGYENLMFDMVDNHPLLDELIDMIEDFNLTLVKKYVALGVKEFGYPEDLGMQVGPMIQPHMFRKYIKPVYERIMAPALEAGCIIHMHSDGDIRALAEDLCDCGMHVLNIQDLVNGIEWIRDNLKGRMCIELDIDRQNITPFGSPQMIDDHIRTIVKELGDSHGGLMLKYGLYPGTPLENAKAVMDAMERYMTSPV